MVEAPEVESGLSACEAEVLAAELCPHGNGADEGGRTLDIHVGNVTFYH